MNDLAPIKSSWEERLLFRTQIKQLLDSTEPKLINERLIRAAINVGEYELASRAIMHLTQDAEIPAPNLLNLATMLVESHNHTAALSLCEKLLQRNNLQAPLKASIHHLAGTILAELGDFPQAIHHLHTTLGIQPLAGPSYLLLASLVDTSALYTQIQAVQSLLSDNPNARNIPELHYAAGHMLWRLEQRQEGLRHFSIGAKLHRQQQAPYNSTQEHHTIEATKLAHQTLCESITCEPQIPTDDQQPVFILAHPRSGTTLLANRLCHHPDYGAAGESRALGLATKKLHALLKEAPGIQTKETIKAELQAAATTYRHIVHQQFSTELTVIDKSMNNSRYIGLIAAMFPGAKFIEMQREPGAIASSCFRTFFTGSLPWSWDLNDIATHFKLEESLWSYWKAQFPKKFITVNYEDLARAPAATLNHCLAELGKSPLSGDTNLPASSSGPIGSASVQQARQPIHRDSLKQSTAEKAFLQPFYQAMGLSKG